MLPIMNATNYVGARLIVRGDQMTMKSYNCEHFEAQMLYFNNVTRSTVYEHGFNSELECMAWLDHRYDCTCFLQILLNYI